MEAPQNTIGIHDFAIKKVKNRGRNSLGKKAVGVNLV